MAKPPKYPLPAPFPPAPQNYTPAYHTPMPPPVEGVLPNNPTPQSRALPLIVAGATRAGSEGNFDGFCGAIEGAVDPTVLGGQFPAFQNFGVATRHKAQKSVYALDTNEYGGVADFEGW